jgi:hypothetical protein
MATLASDLDGQLVVVALVLGAVKAKLVGIVGEEDIGLLHRDGPISIRQDSLPLR